MFFSCNNASKQELSYTEYISPDGKYIVAIPNHLSKDPRSKSDFMAFTGKDVFIYISKQTDSLIDESSLKINQPGDKFVFDLIEETDSTKLYKSSQGLLTLYEYYLIKKLDNNYYLITIKDNLSNKSDIIKTGLRIYTSLRLKEEKKMDSAKKESEMNLKDTNNNVQESKKNYTYTNANYKAYTTRLYTIQYPKDWTVTEKPDKLTDVHIGSNKSNIGLTVVTFDTDKSLESVQKTGDDNMRQAGYDVVEYQNLLLDNTKAYRRTYFAINKDADILSDDLNVTIISYMLKKGNKLINLKFGNCADDKAKETASNIIKTLKFI